MASNWFRRGNMIVAKQTFLFIDGDNRFRVKNNDIIADVPTWVTKLPLYKNAVSSGTIIESGRRDVELDEALNKKTKAQEKQLEEEVKEVKETKKSKKK